MEKKWTMLVVFFVIATIPALAMAGAIEGTIQGFHCVTEGKVCPVGKEDPMAAVESVFVLHVKEKEFYFVPNVDRAVLARHLNRPVKIEGAVNRAMKSIQASKIYAKRNGNWRSVWSPLLEDDAYRELFTGAGGGP
jgi:hypothetical protein